MTVWQSLMCGAGHTLDGEMKKENDRSGVEEEEEHETEKRDEKDDKEEEEKEDNEEDDEDAKAHYHVQPRKKRKKGCDVINKEVPTTAPLPMSANGGTPKANREFQEQPREEPYAFETRVKAEFLCAQQQLRECIENEDYLGAAAAKDSINVLTAKVRTTVPLSMPANGGTPQANREFREQPREEPYVFETPVKARAVEELPCAQQQLSKCIENQDYLGAAAARENIDALTAKGRALRFF